MPKSSKEFMLGSSKVVANSVKINPEHNIPANIANNDKKNNNNFSDELMRIVLTDEPAVPNIKPIVLKRIELQSLYFVFRTDRRIFRKTAKIIIASAHTLINGVCRIDKKNVDFRCT